VSTPTLQQQKKHPNWLLNGHDEHCAEENDAIFS
jgi:hypothetical protein